MSSIPKTIVGEPVLQGWFDLGSEVGPDEVRAFREARLWFLESPLPCNDHIYRRFVPFAKGAPDEVRCVSCGQKEV